jgi:hypothetical protein
MERASAALLVKAPFVLIAGPNGACDRIEGHRHPLRDRWVGCGGGFERWRWKDDHRLHRRAAAPLGQCSIPAASTTAVD